MRFLALLILSIGAGAYWIYGDSSAPTEARINANAAEATAPPALNSPELSAGMLQVLAHQNSQDKQNPAGIAPASSPAETPPPTIEQEIRSASEELASFDRALSSIDSVRDPSGFTKTQGAIRRTQARLRELESRAR
ncbi:MAG: hypothetical protein EOP11_04565 [Proteobacteria bacterium]|nr:MAG: hypothetical protein EOP11_04565 [Pseudomonadota bacterium]